MDGIIIPVLGVILLIAVVTDIRSMRIPNWLTFPAMLMGLGYHTAMLGLDGLLFSAGGLALGGALMLLPFILRVMGAGDVKLMAAAGAFLGARGVLSAFIWTSLAGGLYALVVLLFHLPQLMAILRAVVASVRFMSVTGKLSYIPATKDARLPRLCYGVAIAAGTTFSMLLSSGLLPEAWFPVQWLTAL